MAESEDGRVNGALGTGDGEEGSMTSASDMQAAGNALPDVQSLEKI